MLYRDLPDIGEILFAMSEQPLGEGEEAKVYKVHTKPKYTVRVSHNAPQLKDLHKLLAENSFIQQENIFGKRNFAQAIAWWGNDTSNKGSALITINLYSPGFSLEVHKPGRPKPDAESALVRTLVLSETIANMPDTVIDRLYDDLHFLNSRHHSLDVGGGLFCNTGNILYSAVDNRAFIIDLQPILQYGEHPGVKNNTKGFNLPIYLTRGLLPGAYCYAKEHSQNPELIKLRTEIVNKVINGAQRADYNDIDGYLGSDTRNVGKYWDFQLRKLNIPEKYHDGFIKTICSIEHKNRYPEYNKQVPFMRVSGKSYGS